MAPGSFLINENYYLFFKDRRPLLPWAQIDQRGTSPFEPSAFYRDAQPASSIFPQFSTNSAVLFPSDAQLGPQFKTLSRFIIVDSVRALRIL